MSRYRIRPLDPGETERLCDWARAEGWNPGEADAGLFHRTDPGGFFAAVVDDQTDPVGYISAVRYGGRLGFIGLYIVAPEHRGGPAGTLLARHALKFLGNRCVGTDGVLDRIEQYQRIGGFRFAHRNARYALGERLPPENDDVLTAATDCPETELLEYDRRHYGARRPTFLPGWVSQPRGTALAWREAGRIRGLGVIRPCRGPWKVGPLFADTPAIARSLFLNLQRRADPGSEVFLDVPEPNEAAMAMVREFGMREVFATARLYRNGDPGLPLANIFGITSFELG